jgi:ATP-dependent DNA ligase
MRTTPKQPLDALPIKKAAFVEPMECLSVSKLPEGSQWLWEITLDGYRALAVKSGSHVTLFSRRRKPLHRKFPSIVESLIALPEGTVVDGELVAIDESGRCNVVSRRRNVATNGGEKYETGFHGDLFHVWFPSQFLGRAAEART